MVRGVVICFLVFLSILANSCSTKRNSDEKYVIIDRAKYQEQLYGFWLGQCIANWTGLVTEMDKIGNIGEIKTGDFYTRKDWGEPDQPSIWGEGVPSDLSATIDFVFRDEDEVWGSDDDTDIEYIYQYLMREIDSTRLTPGQIRKGWLRHIKSEEENYLWVANQKAFDLMREGILPPATGSPELNEYYDMIDAQLTTEIFGLFAPGRPDIARGLAYLPIRTTASEEAAWISEFYVTMYSLASSPYSGLDFNSRCKAMAEEASSVLPNSSYAYKMYTYVKEKFDSGIPWEQTRDSVYVRYQINQADGYDITSRKLYCNGCFAAGINFAASLVSWFYGEGDLKETIKIGALTGWDSDNPTATWGGLLGFMLSRNGVESAFNRKFSDQFNIHRTRQNFSNEGIDDFSHMAEVGVEIVDKIVVREMGGELDSINNQWLIPGSFILE